MFRQQEIDRRCDVEDRLRALVIEHEDMQTSLSTYCHENEVMKAEIEALQDRLRKEVNAQATMTNSHNEELHVLRKEITSLEHKLKSCPPVDLSELLDKLGIYPSTLHEEGGGASGSDHDVPRTDRDDSNLKGEGDAGVISWASAERMLVQAVRRAHADAAELRSQASAQTVQYSALLSEADGLRRDVSAKHESIKVLEQQLSEAFASIEAGKALLRCHKIEHASRPLSAPRGGQDMSTSAAASATALSALLGDPADESIADPSAASGVESWAVGGGETSMLRAVLEQRDRMMKSVSEKEQEAHHLRGELDRVKEEKSLLHRDNSELYKRLRLLRVNAALCGESGGSRRREEERSFGVSKGGCGGSVSSNKLSKRKGDGDGVVDDEDDLEGRYAAHYETQLDPFLLQELDRQRVVSRLNVCERGLIASMRMVMQDQWMRHAFLIYLVLVHVFAIGYVVIVLNPELDSEIGRKWIADSGEGSSAGLDPMASGGEWEMHPDNE